MDARRDDMEMNRPGPCGSRRCDAAGFTLIEVAVAMALFSITLIAAGGTLTALGSAGRYGRVRTTAVLHMQRQAEQLYELDYAALAGGQVDTLLDNGTTLRAEWTAQELVPDRLMQVDLRVFQTPRGPGGRERAVRLFIANRNP
ncbi:MAG: prepilin-type N-terminal cleavage/methylation domain-containing protein [Gemmatimonadota bacterium]